jgi:hypothetical protein
MTQERLRQLAERCRELERKAVVPEIKTQLRLWAVEFEAETLPRINPPTREASAALN